MSRSTGYPAFCAAPIDWTVLLLSWAMLCSCVLALSPDLVHAAPQANRLSAEKSPYLLQHQFNPVNWYPWGEEAFAAAQKQKKPIFLSIGYSVCYWCHVMEKESFENEEVAKFLNDHFISIKVDREERPDVDQIYMDAVMRMTGRGGWPMTVFLTPDRKPFFGGTYYPKDRFLRLLSRVSKMWQSDRARVIEAAQELYRSISAEESQKAAAGLSEETFSGAITFLKQSFDGQYGGFGAAPKFPQSARLNFLMRMYHRKADPSLHKMVTETLNAMARGGMYDHLGGGFHRYSTDTQWLIPHYEKMLYDNALLSWTYLEAAQLFESKDYEIIAEETLDYVLREMCDPAGGFYSAQDAGEVGKEGEFYVWKYSELQELLNPGELAALVEKFGVTKQGNFEHGTNALHLSQGVSLSDRGLPELTSARRKLFQRRAKRTPPHLDDKILTGWNGLMIASMAKGYQVLGNERYLSAAQAAARFIRSNLLKDGKLLRRYREGEAKFAGYLEDYSYLIFGLLALYESDFDPQWLRWAEELSSRQDKEFWDEVHGGYYFSRSDDPSLLFRKKELADGAIPSANSVALLNLLRLNHFTFKAHYQNRALELLDAFSNDVSRWPASHASTLLGLDFLLSDAKEVVVVGDLASPIAASMKSRLYKSFLPNKVVAFGAPTSLEDESSIPLFRGRRILGGKTTIYVCEKGRCKLPTNDVEKAMQLISGASNQ